MRSKLLLATHERLRPIVALLALLLIAGACSTNSGSSVELTPTSSAAQATETTAPETQTSERAPKPINISTTTAASSTTAATQINWPHNWTEDKVGQGQFNAGDYAGQDLVLWFWAPW